MFWLSDSKKEDNAVCQSRDQSHLTRHNLLKLVVNQLDVQKEKSISSLSIFGLSYEPHMKVPQEEIMVTFVFGNPTTPEKPRKM